MDTKHGKGAGFPGVNRVCLVCRHFRLDPVGISVNPQSEDEADWLCPVHRSRMTEGMCVLCGRRTPWMGLSGESDIGWCRVCFAGRNGEEAARRAEAAWDELERAGEA